MNKVILLDTLKEFTEQAIKDLIMPVMRQKNDTNEEAAPRPARVYKMSLPDMKLKDKKAPYIIHQIITGKDEQLAGEREQAETLVRTVFAVYSPDEQEGGLMLLNLMERLRIALLQRRVIGGQFALDMQAGIESLIYPDNTPPFYAGEMVSRWRLPGIERQYKLDLYQKAMGGEKVGK
jgi:hypothetical protein